MDFQQDIIVHKDNMRSEDPLVSIILLDWSVREWFQALDWLPRQTGPREQFEIIWIELYDRIPPEAIAHADVVITCGQQGMYHKHLGYNVGLLHARGKVITVCDSDAVFSPDFVSSVIQSFELETAPAPKPLVLMHHEWRTRTTYPGPFSSIEDLQKYTWLELWPNAGACMSVSKSDAIRFGGFDEHKSYRGYLCGPYDLGWRMVNAGIPEIWYDEKIALWHFAHPDPPGSSHRFSWKLWREVAHPHVDYHALEAVEAFSTGRLLPLKENPRIHELRLSRRQIGSRFEEKYARLTSPEGFSRMRRGKLRVELVLEPLRLGRVRWSLMRLKWKFDKTKAQITLDLLTRLKRIIGAKNYGALKGRWRSLRDKNEPI